MQNARICAMTLHDYDGATHVPRDRMPHCCARRDLYKVCALCALALLRAAMRFERAAVRNRLTESPSTRHLQ